jgi:hypothetical protein
MDCIVVDQHYSYIAILRVEELMSGCPVGGSRESHYVSPVDNYNILQINDTQQPYLNVT